MRVGAVFPQTEIGADPAVIRHWAQAVEEMGYRHILAYDHVIGAGTRSRPGWRGYTAEHMFHEVFVLFGYLAGVTTSVELVTGVLVLPQRRTGLVAKQAAEVDVLSGGRLRLGVGVGWNPVEYDVLGESFRDRGPRSAEQVEVLRALWADTTTSFSGRWHRIDDAGINPLPVRRRIPVWFGGYAEAALRRVARLGDGWFPTSPPDEAVAAQLKRLRAHTEEAGRSWEEIGIEARLTLAQVPEDEHAPFAAGWRALGATHLGIDTMKSGHRDVDDHLAALERALRLIDPRD